MNSSSFFQKTPVKVIAAILLFLVFTAAISYGIYYPAQKVYSAENPYTMTFVGASIFTRGLDPEIIDQKTGENSYVLASKGSPLYGRYDMLSAALDENSTIKTAVIEVSYYTLVKKIEDYSLEERLLFFPRVIGLKGKYQTARKDFSFMSDEYDQLYAQLLYDGMDSWEEIFTGKYDRTVSRKGYDPYKATDQSIKTAAKAKKTFNSKKLSTAFVRQNMDDLAAMIELCQSRNINVIVVTLPMTQKFIWQTTGMDDYLLAMQSITGHYNVPYVDFNLLENIGDYFDDSKSYHDEEHLSKTGAPVLSRIMGEILSSLATSKEPLPYRFYDSYEEAKEHSVYKTMQ